MSTAKANRRKFIARRARLLKATEKCWQTATGGQTVDNESKHLYTNAYLEEVRKLSTVTLKAILKGHEDRIVRRAPETLLAIKNEIFERMLRK